MQLRFPFDEYPAEPGPEETHRAEGRNSYRDELKELIAAPRFRLQAAGLLALLFVIVLAIAFPNTNMRVLVDGREVSVSSRATNDEAIVQHAGIDLHDGDTVQRSGADLLVRRATEARVEVDGKVLSLRTQADSIEQLLVEANVPIEAADTVLRDDSFVAPSDPIAAPPALASLLSGRDDEPVSAGLPVTLQVRRGVPFSVVENGQELQLRSSRETVATALRNVGVRLGPGDAVQPALDTELSAGMQIHVDHATQAVVTLPEGKTVIYTMATTVGDALASSDIALPADYRLEPDAGASIEPGMAIHVVAVSQQLELETERIESQTVYEPDASLRYGARRVVAGQDGVHYRQYSVASENGEVTSRELVREWDDPPVEDTVIYYSTAEAPPTPATGATPDDLNVVRVLNVYATWYNPASAGRPPSDPAYGITATGVPVDRGIVAVDPSVIPLGTRMYIPGYGYAVAADTGGGIQGAMIDLGYPDGVTPDWVSHWVDIYILGP